VGSQRGDFVVSLNLFPTDDGGRHGPTPAGHFNCLMTIDEQNFDVRLHLESVGSISPGQQARVPISFLNLKLARKHCSVGQRFSLRESKVIGDGVIEEILFPNESVMHQG
jgi:hypothetical protein